MHVARRPAWAILWMLMIVGPWAPTAAAGVDLGVARIDADPWDAPEDDDGWDNQGVRGNVTTADDSVNMTYYAYCGTNTVQRGQDYPWDGAWCWGIAVGQAAGQNVILIAVCIPFLAEANASASDGAECFAWAFIGDHRAQGFFVCADDASPPHPSVDDMVWCEAFVYALVGDHAAYALLACYDDPVPPPSFDDGLLCYAELAKASKEPGGPWTWGPTVTPYVYARDSQVCVGMHVDDGPNPDILCLQNEAVCFPYNPQALTNACVTPSARNETRPDAQPTVTPPEPTVTPGAGACIVGNVCAPAVSVGNPGVEPGLGMVDQPLPWADGYIEATAACAVAPEQCRVTLP